MFYDNGIVVGPLGLGYNEDPFLRNDVLFLKEIVENPEAKDSKTFYGFINCGSYIICGDTIKVQIIHKSYSINDSWCGYEEWYLIIDKNIHLFDIIPITTNQKEKEHRTNKYFPVPRRAGAKITFVPVPVKPQPDNYWILKEKWFWCNEWDWQNYMNRIKQKKRK